MTDLSEFTSSWRCSAYIYIYIYILDYLVTNRSNRSASDFNSGPMFGVFLRLPRLGTKNRRKRNNEVMDEVAIYALLSASILLLLSYALSSRSKPEHDSTISASRNKRKTHRRKDEAPLKDAHALNTFMQAAFLIHLHTKAPTRKATGRPRDSLKD